MFIEQEKEQLKVLVQEIRQDHPNMSAREIYKFVQPESMGRDKFEAFCFESGFRVKYPVNFCRTTDSRGVTRFDNLLEGLEVTRVNQVWVSDITYYRLGDRFYYLTFIMDLYTRRIVGYSCSQNLRTETTIIPALKKALKLRKGVVLAGLILHSDGGGQYYCKKFLDITKEAGIINSMCKTAYENPHAERLNGIIKNHYLIPYSPKSYTALANDLDRAVNMYNIEKPHSGIEGLSPVNFEKQLLIKKSNIESENNLAGYFPLSTLTTTKSRKNELCLT
jgi:putative transposase